MFRRAAGLAACLTVLLLPAWPNPAGRITALHMTELSVGFPSVRATPWSPRLPARLSYEDLHPPPPARKAKPAAVPAKSPPQASRHVWAYAAPTVSPRHAPAPPVVAPRGNVTAILLCIHGWEELNWAYHGYFDGGLQFLPASWNSAAVGSGHPEWANGRPDLWPASVQLTVGGWWFTHTDPRRQWPNSAPRCGVYW